MTSGTGPNDGNPPKKTSPTPGPLMGGADSLSSKMMRQMVESAPSTDASVDLAALPDVEMPSLEGLTIQVPELPPITEDDIFERFQMMYYNLCVERNVRSLDEPVQLGDEVLLDMIGYIEGRIIPFSAKENVKFLLEENSFLVGFGSSLAGTPVGETTVITLAWPIEDEFGLTQNLTAAFVVQVKGAASLEFPDPEAPDTLAKFGQENMSLDDIYTAIGQQLTAERASAMFVKGNNMALEAVANRIPAAIPNELIQDQIRTMWSQQEGRFLIEKGLNRTDIDAALDGWLNDPRMQAEALNKLRTTLAILTFAAHEDQEVTEEELLGFVEEFSNNLGIDPETWRASVAGNTEAQVAIFDTYLYCRTALHLIAKVSIQYGE